MFQGFCELGDNMPVAMVARTSARVPINADALPTYRVMGPSGLMQNGSGSMAFKDSAAITNASNASPIVISSAGHGLTTGTRVTITDVAGNTAANGTFVVTRINADTFSLDGSTGNGAYTSGGTWNTTGLYSATIAATEANGYELGQTYFVVMPHVISGTNYAEVASFTVT